MKKGGRADRCTSWVVEGKKVAGQTQTQSAETLASF